MKIGIDISQTAYVGTGVARYTTSLLKGLAKLDTDNEYTFFFSSLRQPVPSQITSLLSKNIILKKFNLPLSLLNVLWNKVHIVPIEQFIGNVDVFFSSDWVEPPAKHAKKITTIHDLVPYKFPETSTASTKVELKNLTLKQNIVETHKQRLHWVNKESSIITCNSKATKADAKEILGIDESKLTVIYPGVQIDVNPTYKSTFEKNYSSRRPYILTVGTLQPRKNIARLIKAFTSAALTDVDLYIVGMHGWGAEQEKSSAENIKFLGFVPDEDLAYLYANAEFFVYPALYEGFGYPVVEAMKMGKAVATSNTSSLLELTKGYGVLFDPTSEEQISESIVLLHRDSELRMKYEKLSIERARDFTIEAFAQGFLRVFNALK